MSWRGNTRAREAGLVRNGLRELGQRLPPGWSIGAETVEPADAHVDATAEVRAPDGRTTRIALEAKARLEPREAMSLNERLRRHTSDPLVVIAPYLGEETRRRLREANLGYLDLTGNVWLVVDMPGLYIDTTGANENPDRRERPLRTLRGAKAGRVVRALVDRRPPPGVRELAALTDVDAGYVSRVVALLDSQALIARGERGRIKAVDWPALLRRWAREAPLAARGALHRYLEPRGIPALLAKLPTCSERYVLTGGLAASTYAPALPTRLATLWAEDAIGAAARLGLVAAEHGANVLLVEPGDPGVFEGATERDGLRYAAASQVAADLLTLPGRAPSEGEELIEWMQFHEETWRR